MYRETSSMSLVSEKSTFVCNTITYVNCKATALSKSKYNYIIDRHSCLPDHHHIILQSTYKYCWVVVVEEHASIKIIRSLVGICCMFCTNSSSSSCRKGLTPNSNHPIFFNYGLSLEIMSSCLNCIVYTIHSASMYGVLMLLRLIDVLFGQN